MAILVGSGPDSDDLVCFENSSFTKRAQLPPKFHLSGR